MVNICVANRPYKCKTGAKKLQLTVYYNVFLVNQNATEISTYFYTSVAATVLKQIYFMGKPIVFYIKENSIKELIETEFTIIELLPNIKLKIMQDKLITRCELISYDNYNNESYLSLEDIDT